MIGRNSVIIGAWMLIALNILMAFGSIWIFMRMAPAIEEIIAKNEVSLAACEEMLAALALKDLYKSQPEVPLERFRKALETANNNITEEEEPAIITRIAALYESPFNKGGLAQEQTVAVILQLAKVNRTAMENADSQARQLGYAGAWGVVFMASLVFLAGMLFLRSLKTNLLQSLDEIEVTLSSFLEGDFMRRCSLADPPRRIRYIFNNINEVLDCCSTRRTNLPDQ